MTTFLRQRLWPAIALLVAMTVVTGFLYPLVVTAVAQVAFNHQANGSFIETADGRTIGSSLIGQAFNDPKYFWGRPVGGAADENPLGYDGDRLGRLEPGTDERGPDRAGSTEQVAALRAANGDKPIPVDLVTTSASGLDPDISPAVGRVPGRSRGRGSRHVRGRRARRRGPPHRTADARVPRAATGQRPAAQPGPRRSAGRVTRS